jgi:zinc D-Ala-D-Ala carboxypeptidase
MTVTTFRHWRDVPSTYWRWPSFSPSEIACRGTGKLVVNEHAMDRLQALRDALGKPLIVNSAYRSPEHNRKVGGAKSSRHMQGDAFDIRMTNHDPHAFERAARAAGFTGFGFYRASDFMHIDLGPVRDWGARWPVSAPMFTVEHKPVESLSTSRTMAGSATAGLGGTAIIADTVMEVQKAEASLSTGNIVGLVIGGLILAGAGLAMWARYDEAGRPGWPWGRA